MKNLCTPHPTAMLPESDSTLTAADIPAIRAMVLATGVFTAVEVQVAGELAEDLLSGREESYHFRFIRDDAGIPIAYSCYGEICLTDGRYDLYWIVVSPQQQGKGLAAQLMRETEAHIAQLGGKIVYAETSGTAAYAPARAFYLKQGFREAGRFVDFYRDGDDKVVFEKRLSNG